MARVQPGYRIEDLSLPSIEGRVYCSDEALGKRYLLSFFRFAACPFCNLRVHNLVSQFDEFGDNFTVIAIFDAGIEELIKTGGRHNAPFAILADEDNCYYRQFAVERSFLGVLKGFATRMPQLLYAVFGKGFVPLHIGGHVATMPLNALVDEQGVVQYVHYGRDEGDHIPIDAVQRFALTGQVPFE